MPYCIALWVRDKRWRIGMHAISTTSGTFWGIIPRRYVSIDVFVYAEYLERLTEKTLGVLS